MFFVLLFLGTTATAGLQTRQADYLILYIFFAE